jgi:acyl-CoA thioesterase I
VSTRARFVLLATTVAIAIVVPQDTNAQTVAAPAAASAFPGQYALPPADWKYPVWPAGCRRFEAEERTACLEFVASDFGRLSRFAEANRVLPAVTKDETRVVFFGDSITDRWSQSDAGGFFPGKRYVNRGIGGQTTAQMLIRFRADVLALDPRVVVILAGTNDLAGNAGLVSPDQVIDNFVTMAELATLHRVRVVLASILPVSDDKLDAAGKPLVRSTSKPVALLRSLNQRLTEYAAAHGHVFLDYFTAMATAAGTLKPELNDDGLHPNRAGYDVMRPLAEQAIQRALNR